MLTVFVSYEVLAVAVIGGMAIIHPRFARAVGKIVVGLDAEILIAALGLPFFLLALTYKFSRNLLKAGGKRRILVEWPDYWKLRVVIRVALGFGAASCAAIVVGWLLVQQGYIVGGATTMLAALTVSSITLATVALAEIDEQDILDGAGGT